MHPLGPSASSGPHLESPQDVGPSLCPPETGPQRPSLRLPEFTDKVRGVWGLSLTAWTGAPRSPSRVGILCSGTTGSSHPLSGGGLINPQEKVEVLAQMLDGGQLCP